MKKIIILVLIILVSVVAFFIVPKPIDNNHTTNIPGADPNDIPTTETGGSVASDVVETEVDGIALETTNGYTEIEVAKHDSKSDCWLTIKGDVYDVSSYINKHPGGSRAITDNCGKEVTSLFASIHKNKVWDLLSNYKIGTMTQ